MATTNLPQNSGTPPPGAAKTTPAQWAALISLAAHGKLSGVPPSVLAVLQEAESGDVGANPYVNTVTKPNGEIVHYGGEFGVGSDSLPVSTLKGTTIAAYEAQAVAAAHIFSQGLVANNGNIVGASDYYSGGGDATTFQRFISAGHLPAILTGHFGNSTGDVSPAVAASQGPGGGGGGALGGVGILGGILPEGSAATPTPSASNVPNTTGTIATGFSGIEASVVKDLEVAGYLLAGAAGLLGGFYLLVKRTSQLEEVGWLLLWAGGTTLWSILTKRSPICVFKAAVSGTDTSACVGTVSGGNLFAGTLTALATVYAGSALLRGVGSGAPAGGGGGGGGGNEPTPSEPSAPIPEDVPVEIPPIIP